jgi:lipopolysaccharide export LptBFGC system permease protein LptF
MKQITWEVWLYISVFVFFSLFFMGTMPGSVTAFPNFLWYFIPSVINLAVCLFYGLKDSER